MDIEKLITCIYNRPSLWDKHSKTYNNRDIGKRLWDEVAVEMEVPIAEVKKKWSNLRDQFRKEYNRCTQPGKSGSAADHKSSSWAYYDLLLFLAKQIAPKPLSGNLPEVSPSQDHHDDTESSQFSELSSESQPRGIPQAENLPISRPGTSSSQSENLTSQQNTPSHANPTRVPVTQAHRFKSSTGRFNKKKRNTDVEQEYLQIEKRKLQLFESRSADKSAEDPDRNFLLSLLPYLKEVPRNRKLSVQRKLLDVFMEEERNQPQFSPVSCYSSEELSRPASGVMSSNASLPTYVDNVHEPLSLTTNPMTLSNTSTSAQGHLPPATNDDIPLNVSHPTYVVNIEEPLSLITNPMTLSQSSTTAQNPLYSFSYVDLDRSLQ